MGFELFDSRPLEHGSSDRHHAGTNILGAYRAGWTLKGGLRRGDDQCRQAGKRHERDECRSVKAHETESIIREKCLLVKEKWAYSIDTVRRLWYRVSLCGWSTLYVVSLFPLAAISDDAPAICWCVVLAVVLGND